MKIVFERDLILDNHKIPFQKHWMKIVLNESDKSYLGNKEEKAMFFAPDLCMPDRMCK